MTFLPIKISLQTGNFTVLKLPLYLSLFPWIYDQSCQFKIRIGYIWLIMVIKCFKTINAYVNKYFFYRPLNVNYHFDNFFKSGQLLGFKFWHFKSINPGILNLAFSKHYMRLNFQLKLSIITISITEFNTSTESISSFKTLIPNLYRFYDSFIYKINNCFTEW